jgi:hypothetical protein
MWFGFHVIRSKSCIPSILIHSGTRCLLRKEIAQLEQQAAAAQETLDKTIAELSFDVAL